MELLYHFSILFGMDWDVIFQDLYKEGEEPPPTPEIHIGSFFLYRVSDKQDPSCLSFCFQINKNSIISERSLFFPNFIHLQVFFFIFDYVLIFLL